MGGPPPRGAVVLAALAACWLAHAEAAATLLAAVPEPSPSPCRVALVRPADGALVYGATEVVAEASCPRSTSLLRIEFLVDGQPIGQADHEPYRVAWDAGKTFAARVIEARLIDVEGRVVSGRVATSVPRFTETVQVTGTPIDRVDLSVTVTTREGRTVHGLRAADFIVEEDGRPQGPLEVQADRRPLRIALLIDASSSTRALWDLLRVAAPELTRGFGPRDEARVIAFNGPAFMVQDFTRDAAAIEASIARFRGWGGGTSLYDTLAAAGIALAWDNGGRQAVVLLTDGIDTLSRIDADRVRGYLRRTGVSVETFLLPSEDALTRPGVSAFEKAMARLSLESGGSVRRVTLEGDSGGESIRRAFRSLGEELQNRYRISYTVERPADRAGWRRIEVRTRRKGLLVRTRAGVMTPRDIATCLIDDLRGGDVVARIKAAQWLGALRVPGAAPALLDALGDRSPEVRSAAIAALGLLREPQALDRIIALLSSAEESDRQSAADALRAFGPAAVPGLKATLAHGSEEAQVKAVVTLAAIGGLEAHAAVARAARPAPPPSGPPPAARNRRDRDALDRGRKTTLPPGADGRVRAWALWALGRMGRAGDLPILQTAARDDDPRVRQAALRALGELGDPRALPVLLDAAAAPGGEAENRVAALEGMAAVLQNSAPDGRLRVWALRPENAGVLLAFARLCRAQDEPTAGGLMHAAGGPVAVVELLRQAAAVLPAAQAREAVTLSDDLAPR